MIDDYAYLLSLAKRTRNVGPLVGATATASATNASCGDQCTAWIKVVDGTVEQVSFETSGCVISRASAAALAEGVVNGQSAGTPWAIAALGQMTGREVRDWLGVQVSPLRERCLTTALAALQDAIGKIK